MKLICRYLLKIYLKYLTKLVLFIHKPLIIVVAGSVNKYFVKEEIKRALLAEGRLVRSSPKNFNTEIGLPLSVLYLPSGYNSYRRWHTIIFKALKTIWQKNFPDILVLELGASDPGDMNYLLTIIKPQMAVITDLTQRYLESFSDMNELIEEYQNLILSLPSSGVLVVNQDNNRLKDIARNAKCKVVRFGFDEDSDCRIISVEKQNKGQMIVLSYGRQEKKIVINTFGQHHVYAAAVGTIIKDYA
ncbi:MAG TPA: Mur ligase family protein [bacterium]|nr:Mur ligase family protein [bacterium]